MTIQKLNGNGVRVGTGIVLKVMAGDKFNLRCNSWWNSNNTPGTPVNPLNDLLSALNGGVAAVSSGHYSSGDLNSNSALNPGATDFLNSHTGYSTSIPKAFINWVLFDEQFKFVSSSSGFEQVVASNTFKTHTRTGLPIDKSGYLYVYVSNETPNIDVFFDNLQITHIRGPLISDESFYPYGERMSNLCDRALNFGDPENKKKKFQGQEYNDDLGVDMYEFKYRMDDPQIGRFWQIDPLASNYEYNSTYAFSEDKVIAHVELEGLEAIRAKDVAVAIATAADRLNLGTRLEGVGKVIAGVGVMATGVATMEVPMVGVPIFLEGGDIGGSGLKQIWTGKSEESLTEGVMQDLGVSKEDANNISFLFGGVAGLNPFAEETNAVSSSVKGTSESSSELGAKANTSNSPNFIVDEGGQAFPVPKDAKGPIPVINKNGNITGTAFTGGKGGVNDNVTSIRIMNPNKKNLSGYIKYYNDAKPKQGLDPYSGKTLPNSENHFPLKISQ